MDAGRSLAGLVAVDELDFASLTEISIDPVGPVLRIGYRIPDQGGTQLLYEFALRLDEDQEVLVEIGYAHEPERAIHHLAPHNHPRRLVTDLRSWLDDQLPRADVGGKRELAVTPRRFDKALLVVRG